MVQMIVGKKGKGKTKHLLDKVNAEIKDAQGNVVYLDKSTKHMYELNNKIRLVDVCGIVSQDHDLQKMYFDSFLKIACVEAGEIAVVIAKLEEISDKFMVDFVLSISADEDELPEAVKSKIVISL